MLCIDVHHHFFPEDLNKAASNKSLGWTAPAGTLPWSPEASMKAMDASGIDMAILSLPPLFKGSVSEENRTLTRKRNLAMSSIVREHPSRFAFFACLPVLDDLDGVLEEISYALDTLQAVGISIASSCGVGLNSKYVGDDFYDAVWAELHRRQAVVFLHGAQVASSIPDPHPFLCVPVSQVPNETFKAAAHLVVTGRKRKYRNVKIILAHLGGTTPTLAPRVAVLSPHTGCSLRHDEILEDFKSFYYETALSSYGPNLACIERFVPMEQILFGTDFPAVSVDMTEWYTKNLKDHYMADGNKLEMVLSRNALSLFPSLQVHHTEKGSS